MRFPYHTAFAIGHHRPMPFFFARLVPKRKDFPANLTPDEGATMQRHSAFLTGQLEKGALVVAGPVMDPSGVFGLAVIESESIDAARELLGTDPANALGHYEVAPMGPAIVRAR